MKKYMLILKAVVLAGIGILIFSGYAAAPQNINIYKGELTSGSTKVGNLSSNEMWLLYGEKDSHVVISTQALDQGKRKREKRVRSWQLSNAKTRHLSLHVLLFHQFVFFCQ